MRSIGIQSLALTFALVGASSLSAATVTSDVFTGGATNDFSDLENIILSAGETRTFTLNGVNVTYTNGSSGVSSYEAFGNTQLWNNGVWGNDRNGYISAYNGTQRTMSFSFGTGISQIGALINYLVRSDMPNAVKMEIFDFDGNSLEQFDITGDAPITSPPATPGGLIPMNNYGEFRGFTRTTADIFRFEFTGGNNIVLDDLTLSGYVPPAAVIPLPAGLPLLLAGLGALGLVRRRKR